MIEREAILAETIKRLRAELTYARKLFSHACDELERARAELAAEKERASEVVRKADQFIRDLFIPSPKSGTGEHEWNAAVSTSLNCLKRASNAAPPQMEGGELVKAHRAYFDGYMEARFTVEAPPQQEAYSCGREGCGATVTCARPFCPLVITQPYGEGSWEIVPRKVPLQPDKQQKEGLK